MRPILFLALFSSLASAAPGQQQQHHHNEPPIAPIRAHGEQQERQRQKDERFVRVPMRRRAPTKVLKRVLDVDNHQLVQATHTTHSTPTPIPSPIKSNLTALILDVAYAVTVYIGHPPQRVTVDFDTGSSEFWIDPPCTQLEDIPAWGSLCRQMGVYLPQHSETFIDNNATCPPRWITYGSGATYIEYYRDTMVVGETSEFGFDDSTGYGYLSKPVQFGLASWAEGMVSGILGAGYGIGYNQNYSNFIDALYEQKQIRDKDFSVALGSIGDEFGEVIFGGIDLSKFMGPLHGVSLADQYSGWEDGYYRYWINVTEISVTPPGSCVSTPVTNSTWTDKFLPDTGTTLTYMPEEAFYLILNYFPDAKPAASYGYVINCSHVGEEGTIDFTLDGGFVIHVPYKDFIFQVPPIFPDDPDEIVCVLGAVPTSSFYILGDTFLRSTMALFRQQEHKIYFGQYKDCGSEIVSSHDSVDGIIGNCGHRRPYKPTHGGGGDDGGDDGGDGGDSANPSPEDKHKPYVSIIPLNATSTPTAASTAWTPTGYGTCRTFTTGTYSPLFSTASPDPTAISIIANLPRPKIQTNGPQRAAPFSRPSAWGDDDIPCVQFEFGIVELGIVDEY
ncbi:hypothetical protein OQA88_8036 [Cercophora sp. LCS_1]